MVLLWPPCCVRRREEEALEQNQKPTQFSPRLSLPLGLPAPPCWQLMFDENSPVVRAMCAEKGLTELSFTVWTDDGKRDFSYLIPKTTVVKVVFLCNCFFGVCLSTRVCLRRSCVHVSVRPSVRLSVCVYVGHNMLCCVDSNPHRQIMHASTSNTSFAVKVRKHACM